MPTIPAGCRDGTAGLSIAVRTGASRYRLAVGVVARLLLIAGLWLGGIVPLPAQNQEQAGTRPLGIITGKLVGHALEGTPVVLLRFTLNAEGQPEGGPIARTATDGSGGFLFADVTIEAGSVYRVGTRVGGRLVGSDPFTFPAGQHAVRIDLEVPQLSEDPSAIQSPELLVVVEPYTGGLWVTEVFHLTNPGPNVLDTRRAPLELPLQDGATAFEALRVDAEGGETERLGPKLLVRGQFAPGTNVVAYRYKIGVYTGQLDWERQYDWPIGSLRVLSPEGQLSVSGTDLAPGTPETFQQTVFSGLERKDIAPGELLAVTIAGIPLPQWLYLYPLAGFVLVVLPVLIWFLRVRLGRAEPAA